MRTRFDQFGKHMLRDAFAPAGPVETDAEVSSDARHVDVWVMPDPARGTGRDDLGMLGRIGRGPATFELCHCTPDGRELAALVHKHGEFRHQLSRRDPAPPLPVQWVISSGRPDDGIEGLRFLPDPLWGDGVHDGPPLLWTKLLVVSELPRTRDTLLLRLLGAGKVLRQAIAELDALGKDAPERALAKPILLKYKLEIPADPAKRTDDDKEFLMYTQDIVERWHNEAVQEGVGEGVARSLIDAYEVRFGAMPPELRAAIEATHDVPTLRGWLKLAITRSAEEIAAAIHAPRAA